MEILILVIVILAALILWIYVDNVRISVTHYDVVNSRIPQEFEGFRIVQISDLHNTEFGRNNERLISAVVNEKPDVIFITGDFIDSRHTNTEISGALAKELVKIAPVYYVAGNHEGRIPEVFGRFEKELSSYGVHILRDRGFKLGREGAGINIIGIDDPEFVCSYKPSYEIKDMISAQIRSIKRDDSFTVLLAHRPEVMDVYREEKIDLVFSGHEHGGQFRIPFIGGVYAPIEGFFPKYSEGMITENDTTMIVSRGLGQSVFPFRVNNPPELVVAELHMK